MLTVGERFPAFKLTATVSLEPGREFEEVTHESHPGRWRVVFFWPMDFTFVCPTEIAEFGRRAGEFRARGAEVLGVSTDTHYVHLAWRRSDPSLKTLPIPMLADTRRELSTALGILHREEGVPLRATFLVDPDGIIRHVSVNDLSVGRNIEEVLRLLDALQTGALTPCEWRPGQKTLDAA
jgi:peroxiredoxin (alkyl hydroperoxide reductase subunit C)